MPARPNDTAAPAGKFVTRVPVVDGRLAIAGGEPQAGGKLWDDLGREVKGTVAPDGRLTLDEPTERRIYWAGWVKPL